MDEKTGSMTRVAVVQASPKAFDLAATLLIAEKNVASAAARGARVVVFPEAFLGGYPKGLDFGARLGMRSESGRDDFARYHAGAINIPGPEIQRLMKLAADQRVDLVMGVVERDAGTLYCSVIFINAQGRYLGKHRKLMPTALERVVWGLGDGSTLPVFETANGRIGAVICWENYMPLLRMSMYAQNIQMYCAPTVDDRDSWIPSMRHIATEGRCFVLSACQFTRRSDYPRDYACIQGDNAESMIIRGGSCIVSPFGEVLAGPVYGEESVLTADLDFEQIIRGRYDLDVSGHYSRPDIFQLHVNTQVQQTVTARVAPNTDVTTDIKDQ